MKGKRPAPGATGPRLRAVAARKLKTFRALSVAEKLLLPPVFLMIILSSLTIAWLPFRRLSALFGRHLGAIALVPLATDEQHRRAVMFRRAIALASAYVPGRSDCYPQAIAAVLLCRWSGLPYALHFGAAPPDSEAALRGFLAHAWVTCGKVAITGGRSFDRCSPLACYVSPRLRLVR